jgi:hypothetical protein
MARPLVAVHLIAAILTCGAVASGQQQPHSGPPKSAALITFGEFAKPLNGPWKFQIGDSSVDPATGQMQWTEPDFDDSKWASMDLTPPPASYNAPSGSAAFVPGWTARGYAAVTGYAWYRLNLVARSQPDLPNPQLALMMPASVDDAYQVFANGQLIGEFGHFNAEGVRYYQGQPRAFRIPSELRDGPLTLAIRFYMAPSSMAGKPAAGGLHAPPVLGPAPAIFAMTNLSRHAVLLFASSFAVEGVILIFVICLVFVLYWLDRTEKSYLWLGLECSTILIYSYTLVSMETSERLSQTSAHQILAIAGAVVPVFWILFFAVWFRLGRINNLHLIVWPLALLDYLCSATVLPPLYSWMGHFGVPHWMWSLNQFSDTPLVVVLVWVGYLGIRHNRSEGLLALPAVLLVAAGHVQWVFSALHVPAGFQPFGIDVHFYQLGTMAALLMFTVRLLQRFFLGQRERDQLQQEMEQARQVQQILVPDAMPVLPGFTVESEYRSARHVGGDFFQILPEDDNSLLLIIGDVSGKGLKAAMLVSMIVGAIRVVVDHTKEPLKILEDLNRHMCGRIGQQFATCLVVRIAADGTCILANAGHLAPYHNGCEVTLAGSVPLGLVEGADFEQVGLTLEPGGRLVMITDGIVEAKDAKQQLFGFERTMELVGRSHSAAEVAAVAQRFGQDDDITVLCLERTD